MPDAPIVSRPYHAKMACPKCVWNRDDHSIFCEKYRFMGMRVKTDPTMDQSTVRIEDDHGNVLGSIVNIGNPKE